jgi:hypothetical protein
MFLLGLGLEIKKKCCDLAFNQVVALLMELHVLYICVCCYTTTKKSENNCNSNLQMSSRNNDRREVRDAQHGGRGGRGGRFEERGERGARFEERRAPAENRFNDNNNKNDFNNFRAAPREVDHTVDALVAFARSILNERQCIALSERLAVRRPPRQDQPFRTPLNDDRRPARGGRGRGAADNGIPFGQNGGRGGRAARGGRTDEGHVRPATAPASDVPRPTEPRRRNNRRPIITPQ